MDYYLFTLELKLERDGPWTVVTIFKQYPRGAGIDSLAVMYELVDLFNSAFEVKASRIQKLEPNEIELESRDIYKWDW